MKRSHILVLGSVLLLCSVLQTEAQQPVSPRFDVASIKPNNSGSGSSGSGMRPGGLYIANNVPLKWLIMEAYRVFEFQVMGGPAWLTSDRFDVEAKADAAATTGATPNEPFRPSQMSLMLQSLLTDRFQLKIHRDTRELPVYALVVGKSGAKLTAADRKDQCGGPGEPQCPGTTSSCCTSNMAELRAVSVSLENFADTLSRSLKRRVIDRTDIKGFFTITLRWTPDDIALAVDGNGVSMFTAIQEQLGLRLESTTDPVEVIVIDNVERPTSN